MVYVVIFVLGLAYGVLGQGNSHHNDTSTNLRLVGGPSNATGLLQLMYHGEWVHFHSATSSSPYFTQMDAKVVCNMLGYGNRTAAYAFGPADGNKLFGSQQGRILVNVQFSCHGNETDLTQCSGWSNSFSLFTGYSGNDVAVTCDRGAPPSISVPQGNYWSEPVAYIRSGTKRTINCVAKGSLPFKYKWTVDGNPVKNTFNSVEFSESNGTLFIGEKFSKDESGNYSCVVSNIYGETMTPYLQLIRAESGNLFPGNENSPAENIQLNQYNHYAMVCKNQPSSIPPLEIKWEKGTMTTLQFTMTEEVQPSNRLVMQPDGTLHFLWLESTDSQYFRCSGTNPIQGVSVSNPLILKLNVATGTGNSRSPEIKYNEDVTVMAGKDAKLTCIFSYYSKTGENLRIKWLRNNEELGSGTTLTLLKVKVPDDKQSQAGEYVCEAYLGDLQPVRAKVMLKITSPPEFVPSEKPAHLSSPVDKDAMFHCRATSHNTYQGAPVWMINMKPLIGCPPFYFDCGQPIEGFARCIPIKQFCDSNPDCPNSSDEKNCPSTTCTEGTKLCNGACIPNYQTCTPPPPCDFPSFSCDLGKKCLPRGKICDGIAQCSDGKDEEGCAGRATIERGKIERPFRLNSQRTQLTIPRAQKNDVMCVQCLVSNMYGTIFGDGCLTVIALAQGNSHSHGNATQARLVGGSSNATGLLELYHKGEWLHMSATSASYFTQSDAKVVCNMLGFGNSGTAYAFSPGVGNKLFGSLHSQAWVNIQLNCQGTETDVTQCRGWSNSFSLSAGYQGYDVALSCERTQLRLQDGDTSHSGRVEIFIKGDWHSICDSGFDDTEAQVVCDMLGLHSTGIAKAFRGSHFGQGSGEILIGSLNCQGNEADIMECSPAFGSNCNHRNDAGVNCDSTPVRLVDGPSNTSGRVEVMHGGTWGTICGDSNFDSKAVQVICRMIGVNNPHAFGYGYAYYGEGQGYIVINQLRCDGTESDISTCHSSEWTPPGPSASFGCSHSQDAGVNCDGQTLIRLSDGVSEQSGRLEVLHNGHWGTVSSYGFDNHELAVVCRMLGYEYSANSFFMPNGYYGQGIGEVLVRDLACHGMESDIGLCGGNWWPKTNPGDHNQDVGVNCDGVIPIRLGGDGNATAGVGRVEILHNNQYGTVCSSNFDRLDLIVVCRMLGYNRIPTSAYWYHGPTYAQGLGEIAVTNLACNGIEYSIGQCSGQWPATRSCSHDNDVFVNCLGASETMRLIGGSHNYTGRVEIFHAGQWGTICDSSFDRADAVVICRILGFQNPERAVAYTRAHFGAADSHVPMVMTDLQCNGLETTLGQCNPTWESRYCTHNQDIGVDCCPNCQPSIVG